MHKIYSSVLNEVNEGIVLTNDNIEITFWNNYMEHLTGFTKEITAGCTIFSILPNLNKDFYKNAIKDVSQKGNKIFFSAAMHKALINDKNEVNLKVSKLLIDDKVSLLFEFIDVTNQMEHINQLKNYLNKLSSLNKELTDKEKIIKSLAYYDQLTGLANRRLFYKLANRILFNAKRNHEMFGLMFIDVDKFKSINDNYGHKAGDEVLNRVAKILKNSIDKNDEVTRFGGDEFLILLPSVKSVSDYKTIVTRISNYKHNAITYEGQKIEIALSIGVSFFPQDGDSIDRLIITADKAMYAAKSIQQQGKCSCCTYSQ